MNFRELLSPHHSNHMTLILFKGLRDPRLIPIKGQYSGVVIESVVKMDNHGADFWHKISYDATLIELVDWIKKYETIIVTGNIFGVNLWYVLNVVSGEEIGLQYLTSGARKYYDEYVKHLPKPSQLQYYPTCVNQNYSKADLDCMLNSIHLMLDDRLLVSVRVPPWWVPHVALTFVPIYSKGVNRVSPGELYSLFQKRFEHCSGVNCNDGILLLSEGQEGYYPLILIAEVGGGVIKRVVYGIQVDGKWVTVDGGRVLKGFFPQVEKVCHYYDVRGFKHSYEFESVLRRHVYILKKCYGSDFFWSFRENFLSKRLVLDRKLKIRFNVNPKNLSIDGMRILYST